MSTAQHHWWSFGARARSGAGSKPDRADSPPRNLSSIHQSADGLDLHAALDLVARVLRLIGEVPVLPDQPNIALLRTTCEAWARHVLTLAPPPGEAPASDDQRAWSTLNRFLAERRHTEQEIVATNLADLRRAVVVIADAVRGALVHEHADTSAVLEAVNSLQLVAVDGSLEQLRGEVSRAAALLHILAAERDTRQQELTNRVALLSDQVQILVEEVRQAQQVGTTDALTGLLNRAGYEAAARRGLGLSLPSGHVLSLAIIDLDDLKWVNDQHGHAAGDAAIRALADSLRTTCRTTDELARIGGDEFAVILLDADAGDAERIIQRFMQELWSRNLPVATGSGSIRVSASVGIAEARPTDDLHSWAERADRWLYRAKGMGKNRLLGDASPGEQGDSAAS